MTGPAGTVPGGSPPADRRDGGPARPPTPSQTIGPFFRFATEWLAGGELDGSGPGGRPTGDRLVTIVGRVSDGDGAAVPDALLELWYPGAGLARRLTDIDGAWSVRTTRPAPGPGGQAPHLEVSLFARGLLQRLWTRIYFPDEPAANAADPLLRSIGDADRAATLVARPDGPGLRFDIRLQGDRETVFLAW